ncbi:NUDIX hydrolase [Plesiomonas shigelloides]|uniref:NUDIX hydrolase n=1 Tax=Plesiomonas shigelloides TaxID=703 RepID=UPI001C49BA0E|nr:NUDIX domain-containing protein [Plesiomonas shigelloides]
MIIDKLAWILIRDGKLLTVRSKGKSLFYLPGGKREAGESDEQALLREIKEELDVDLIPETIKYIGTFEAQADGKSEGVTVNLTCYLSDYSGHLHPESEIEELKFIGADNKSICSLATLVTLEWLEKNSMIS